MAAVGLPGPRPWRSWDEAAVSGQWCSSCNWRMKAAQARLAGRLWVEHHLCFQDGKLYNLAALPELGRNVDRFWDLTSNASFPTNLASFGVDLSNQFAQVCCTDTGWV